MDIKYDNSGHPLEWKDQPASKQTEPQQTPPVAEAAPEPPSEIQLSNPFVAEYLKQQETINNPQPESEPVALNVEEAEPVEPEPIQKKEDHPNFRALKASAERAERERDEFFRMLQERERRDQVQTQPRLQQDDVDDLDITDDGFVEPKHIKKVYKAAKQAQRELAEYKQKAAKEMQEMMLYKQYPDIDSVVSPENIALLTELKPAYARQLAELNRRGDIYGTGELAYNYMVDLGIHKTKQPTNAKDYTADKMRAHANAMKPRPVVSGTATKSDSPLARAHAFAGELNDADMRKHYQEMEAAIRNRGD